MSSFTISTGLLPIQTERCETKQIVRRLIKQDGVSTACWVKDFLLDLTNGFLRSIVQDVISLGGGEIPRRLLIDCGGETKFIVRIDMRMAKKAKESRPQPQLLAISLRITLANNLVEASAPNPARLSDCSRIDHSANLVDFIVSAVNSGSKQKDLLLILMPRLLKTVNIQWEEDINLNDHSAQFTLSHRAGGIKACEGRLRVSP